MWPRFYPINSKECAKMESSVNEVYSAHHFHRYACKYDMLITCDDIYTFDSLFK